MAIPLSYLATVLPGVLSAGADQNTLYALMLTQNPAFPAGAVQAVTSAASVSALVGSDQLEAELATTYFTGFTGSPRKPSTLYVARFVDAETPASLIGGKVPLTLAQVQALTGSFTINMDGTTKTVTPMFAGVTSMSGAAAAIQTALGTGSVSYSSGSGGFTITSTAAENTTYAVSSIAIDAAGTGFAAGDAFSFAGGTGSVSTVGASGAVTAVNLLTKPSQTTDPAGAGIAATATSGTGTGLTLTVTSTSTSTGVSESSAVGYGVGTMADSLGLSEKGGAIQSTAILDDSVSAQLTALKNTNGMWSHFFCAFDPETQRDDMVTWVGSQNDDYGAILHDTTVTAAQLTAGTSWAQTITANGAEGICPVYMDPNTCALIASVPACVNWSATNGRYNVAFRRSSIMTPVVTDLDLATSLEAAGYNFYAQVAGSGTTYNGVYPGSVTGQYLWMDSFFNQIWMRRNFQLNEVDMLFNLGQIPYNTQGDAIIQSALKPTIDSALNFGAIRAGVALSEAQIQEITLAFGNNAAQTIQTSGWYLYTNAASVAAPERGKRRTPPVSFYYTDGQSVQRISMNAVEVA